MLVQLMIPWNDLSPWFVTIFQDGILNPRYVYDIRERERQTCLIIVWMNRVSKSHTTPCLANTFDAVTNTRMALKRTTLLNRCRIIPQSHPTISVLLNIMLSYAVIFVLNLVSLATALPLLCKASPILY